MSFLKEKEKFPEIKKIIAVASGKGGVGKSTVSVNLAYALAAKGYKTAIYDADIYGPSIPILFGLENSQPEVIQMGEEEKIIPALKDDIQVMSIGFFLNPEQPAIWRGPAASSYLKQFLMDTLWKDVDYLIIDLPPGTGDIILTLCQDIPLDGAIIVTTPQKLSLADVQKSVMM
nr:P-loop NTPase [Candidatus Kapabacteria bacterium]